MLEQALEAEPAAPGQGMVGCEDHHVLAHRERLDDQARIARWKRDDGEVDLAIEHLRLRGGRRTVGDT